MILFWQIIFWFSVGTAASSYLLYPALVRLLAAAKNRPPPPPAPAEWPAVEVLFAAHNEEAVLEAKLQSIFASHYPAHKLSVRVGSDCSEDHTNAILEKWEKKVSGLEAHIFEERQGKANIINRLSQISDAEILVLTDANIIFEPSTITALVQRLISHPEGGAVGGSIHYRGSQGKGISGQEQDYLHFENRLKEAESRLWGFCLGLEGGCYAVHKNLFPIIPPLFFMEDFFVTLHLLEQKKQVLWEPAARVWEDVSTSSSEEYRRKLRISIGNWQNLGRFKHLLWRRFWPLGLAFAGHKVLRWLTPFTLLLLLVSATQLSLYHWFYALAAGLYMTFIGLGLFGILVSHQHKGGFLKYPGHFIYMNLALLDGFFTYLKGVKSNAWQPTARNQN